MRPPGSRRPTVDSLYDVKFGVTQSFGLTLTPNLKGALCAQVIRNSILIIKLY